MKITTALSSEKTIMTVLPLLMTFGFSGDTGLVNSFSKTHGQNIARFHPDVCAFLLLGDNFYPDGVRSEKEMDMRWRLFRSQFLPMTYFPFYAVLGNHDYLGDPFIQLRWTLRSRKWNIPHFYYDWKIAGVHFIFLDTVLLAPDITRRFLSPSEWEQYRAVRESQADIQKSWLGQTLRDSRARWKIVCGHYPCISHGNHAVSRDLQSFLVPLMEEYGVHAYLSGHDHQFQHIPVPKTTPHLPSSSPFLREGRSKVIHYIISGSFCDQKPLPPVSFSPYPAFRSSESGWTKMQVYPSHILVQWINLFNEVAYSFIIK